MLPCQRELFEIPADLAYLDSAAYGPIPRPVRAAGEKGVATKSTPWATVIAHDDTWADRCRAAAAKLVGGDADGIALGGSVAFAMATAAANLEAPRGTRILRIEREFPSQSLPWDRLAAHTGAMVDVVPWPKDGDWTAAILAHIARKDAPPLSIAALTPSHWTDGAFIDLDAIAPVVRKAGAALVIDATQAAGAMPVDATRWDADFVAFPTYKWTLGPYSHAFLYAAPRRRDGQPLELHGANQNVTGARRYDRGERNDPIGLPMAATAMELVLSWGVEAVAERLRHLTGLMEQTLREAGCTARAPARRVGHVLGLRPAGGLPEGTAKALAGQRIIVSERDGALRISPHVYVTEEEAVRAARAIAALPAFRA